MPWRQEHQAATRHAREQLKRLLHFVKRQLGDDLATWRGYTDSPPPELTDQVGKQRALATKLESALHDLMGAPSGIAKAQRASGEDCQQSKFHGQSWILFY